MGFGKTTRGVQADFTPYEGKSAAAAVIDPESAAAQDHDMDLALALQMQEVRAGDGIVSLVSYSRTSSGQHCS